MKKIIILPYSIDLPLNEPLVETFQYKQRLKPLTLNLFWNSWTWQITELKALTEQ
jgi:hypothetical protein